MAYVVLASLKATMEYEIQRPRLRVLPDDVPEMESIFKRLAPLEVFLDKFHIKADEDPEFKEVENEIKAFALKAEDKIELQLRKVLLAKRKEEAHRELHQRLGEIRNDIDALLQKVNKYGVSVRLICLRAILEFETQQPSPRVLPEDVLGMESLLIKLAPLQVFLDKFLTEALVKPKIKDMEDKIEDFALKTVDKFEVQLRKVLLANDSKQKEEALTELHQSLEETRNDLDELLLIVNKLGISVRLICLRETLRVLPDDVPKMESPFKKLAPLQAFLDKFYIEEHEDVEDKTKGFALSAEEKIEMQLRNILLAKDSKRKEEALRELHHSLEDIRNHLDGLLQIVDKHYVSSEPFSDQDNMITSAPPARDDKMVGRVNELMEIKLKLLSFYRGELLVISISGMGGIGKTTLARTVYNDPSVASYFDLRAWATVSQDYNAKHIFISLLRCICPITPEETKEATKDDLAMKLRKYLAGQRYLIVVDDVWSTEAWEDIQRCFPDHRTGSRILLTTRIEEVAGSSTPFALNVMNPDESWHLFCRNAEIGRHLSSSPRSLEFEAIGRKIVEQCKGLPLGIVVVAGLLSRVASLEGWKTIQKEISSMLSDSEQCSQILVLSYKHLPPHLKRCFLHMGVFPEDSEMPAKKLVRLWIAEGLVKLVSGKRLEDVALEYLVDLIKRSIILIRHRSSSGKIKTCSMHDLIHDFCVNKAETENLLYAGSMRRSNPDQKLRNHEGFRWLSFWPNYGNVYLCYNLDKSRSLSFLHKDAIPTLVGKCLPSNLLRVMDLAQLPPISNRIFRSLRGLVLLRYMDITLDYYVSPEDLTNIASKNQNLQTLIVSLNRTNSSWVGTCLPSKIWESPQLRHVEVSYALSVDPPSKLNEGLHTLYWLSLEHCTVEIFSRIPNVKKLGVLCGSESNLNGVHSDNLENLGLLAKLETLMIAFRKGSRSGLQNLNFLQQCCNIKKLKLKRTSLPWSELNVISTLPFLEVLKLKEFSDDPEWNFDEGYFSKLKFLFLEAKNLTSWEIYEGEQFVCLERLALKKCSKLEAIPTGFEEIESLKSIELKNCSHSAFQSVKDMNDNRESYGYGIVAIRHVDQIQEEDDEDNDEDDDDDDDSPE